MYCNKFYDLLEFAFKLMVSIRKRFEDFKVFVGSIPTPSDAKPSRRQVFEPRLPSFLKDLRPSLVSSRFIIRFSIIIFVTRNSRHIPIFKFVDKIIIVK